MKNNPDYIGPHTLWMLKTLEAIQPATLDELTDATMRRYPGFIKIVAKWRYDRKPMAVRLTDELIKKGFVSVQQWYGSGTETEIVRYVTTQKGYRRLHPKR